MFMAPLLSIIVFLLIVNPLMKWINSDPKHSSPVNGWETALWLCGIVIVIVVIALILGF
jgi:hypothetical protein